MALIGVPHIAAAKFGNLVELSLVLGVEKFQRVQCSEAVRLRAKSPSSFELFLNQAGHTEQCASKVILVFLDLSSARAAHVINGFVTSTRLAVFWSVLDQPHHPARRDRAAHKKDEAVGPEA